MNSQLSSESAALELMKRRAARTSLLDFITYTKPDYEVSWHHRVLCEYIDLFVEGKIRNLAVSMPPRHGKSEVGSRRTPAYILGKYPDKSIIACSYSADLASRMNRDVQRIIDSKEYRFPVNTLPKYRMARPQSSTKASALFLRAAGCCSKVERCNAS